jgi:ABC-type lipoprotein release transport system permease subunit
MAFDRGRGRTAVPVRPALVGTAASIGGIVAVLTFSAGLQRLTTNPARYGFGWDVQVVDPGVGRDPRLLRDLERNPDIEAVALGLFRLSLVVEGRPVNATGIRPIDGDVFTTIIEGRPARGADEIVLGGDTLDRLDRRVGDIVRADGPAGSRRFLIVGRGVFPSPDDPLPFADGAALTAGGVTSLGLADATVGDSFTQYLVRWTPEVDRDAARTRLARNYELIESSAPPEIERLTQVDELPRVLAGFLALLAVLAVGHALLTGVQRRRHDFAVLKTLGFVSRQLSAAVAWQASALAVVGLMLGIPLGLVAGRWSWALVARGIGVATDPAMPAIALVLAVPAALLVANVVAFVPARMAARTNPAVTLRAE